MPEPMVLKLIMEVGRDKYMAPTDLKVIKAKIKVTVTWKAKMLSKC